jgi:hypothetical protein
MGTDPQPWSPRPKDDVLTEPQSFLADLGWSPVTGPTAAAKPLAQKREQLYCSFCWHLLAAGAQECAECGQNVNQMEAALQARVQEDRNWIPPRMWKDGQAPVAPRPAGRGRVFQPASTRRSANEPALAPAPVTLSWKHILVAVGIGGFVGGATVAAVWVAIQAFGRPVGATTLLAPTTNQLVSVAPARLAWRNPVAELRLELVSGSGAVVASSLDHGPAKSVEAGQYRLRITDNTGQWAPPEEQVTAAPGETLSLGPTPRVMAGFYLWAGKKLYQEQKLDRAERVWIKAVNAYPEGAEPHLQLAALLAVKYRYAEARHQVQAVLVREPGNSQALQLLHTLDSLEKNR